MSKHNWYHVDKTGVVTSFKDKAAAEENAKLCDSVLPSKAPHRVCQIVPVYESDGHAQAGVRLARLIMDRDEYLKNA